jgi:hypothetical protein
MWRTRISRKKSDSQIIDIHHANFEIDGGVYQPGEQLEETKTESEPMKLEENNLLREMVEQQFSEETLELKFVGK